MPTPTGHHTILFLVLQKLAILILNPAASMKTWECRESHPGPTKVYAILLRVKAGKKGITHSVVEADKNIKTFSFAFCTSSFHHRNRFHFLSWKPRTYEHVRRRTQLEHACKTLQRARHETHDASWRKVCPDVSGRGPQSTVLHHPPHSDAILGAGFSTRTGHTKRPSPYTHGPQNVAVANDTERLVINFASGHKLYVPRKAIAPLPIRRRSTAWANDRHS